jgi:hypothetical protein
MTDKAACIAATICAHGYLQNPEDEGRVARVIRQSLESPEPQADDVETIRDALAWFREICIENAEEWDGDDCPIWVERFETLYVFIVGKDPFDDGAEKKEKSALSRLSAPIDVQAKAEAVESILIRKCSLTGKERKELSRLIVEQFSRKG